MECWAAVSGAGPTRSFVVVYVQPVGVVESGDEGECDLGLVTETKSALRRRFGSNLMGRTHTSVTRPRPSRQKFNGKLEILHDGAIVCLIVCVCMCGNSSTRKNVSTKISNSAV